jgi:hypothetical protein
MLLGGALLVASAFLPWVRRGPGRTLHGHDLVDAVVALGNNVPGLSSGRLAVLWYLVPALGAATWAAVGLLGRASRTARVVAGVGAAVAALTVVAFGRVAGFGDLGLGALAALVGAGALACGSALTARRREAAGTPSRPWRAGTRRTSR